MQNVNFFETEDKKCLENQKEIFFDKSIEYNFFFYKHQKIKLKFLKKIRDNANLIIKVGERKTTFSSIIISPECKYKRPLDKQNKDKDIFCIKVNKIFVKDIINYTILDYLKSE